MNIFRANILQLSDKYAKKSGTSRAKFIGFHCFLPVAKANNKWDILRTSYTRKICSFKIVKSVMAKRDMCLTNLHLLLLPFRRRENRTLTSVIHFTAIEQAWLYYHYTAWLLLPILYSYNNIARELVLSATRRSMHETYREVREWST